MTRQARCAPRQEAPAPPLARDACQVYYDALCEVDKAALDADARNDVPAEFRKMRHGLERLVRFNRDRIIAKRQTASGDALDEAT